MSVVWSKLNKIPVTLLKAGLKASTVIAVRLKQEMKAPSPMLVTPLGIVMRSG